MGKAQRAHAHAQYYMVDTLRFAHPTSITKMFRKGRPNYRILSIAVKRRAQSAVLHFRSLFFHAPLHFYASMPCVRH